MAEERFAGEDMSTESIYNKVFQACHDAREDFEPFRAVMRRGHGQVINLAPVYHKEFRLVKNSFDECILNIRRELQLNFEKFWQHDQPDHAALLILRDGRCLVPSLMCGEGGILVKEVSIKVILEFLLQRLIIADKNSRRSYHRFSGQLCV